MTQTCEILVLCTFPPAFHCRRLSGRHLPLAAPGPAAGRPPGAAAPRSRFTPTAASPGAGPAGRREPHPATAPESPAPPNTGASHNHNMLHQQGHAFFCLVAIRFRDANPQPASASHFGVSSEANGCCPIICAHCTPSGGRFGGETGGSVIPLTGDAQADADIMAFLRARQNILKHGA